MGKSLRISIADDERDMREFLTRILPRFGHEVVSSAENGRQLVADYRRLLPDLVITDVRMPELDGLEAIREIRSDLPVPVILISAHQEPGPPSYLPAGPTLYLTKPIDRQNLQDAIAQIMGNMSTSR